MRQAIELAPAKREIIFNIHGLFRIMGKFLFRMFKSSKILFLGAQSHYKFPSVSKPPFKQRLPFGLGVNKIFNFHLLKFPQTKNKIASDNFVSKGLADLGDAKGYLDPHRINNIFKIHKNSAGSVWPKIDRSLNAVHFG